MGSWKIPVSFVAFWMVMILPLRAQIVVPSDTDTVELGNENDTTLFIPEINYSGRVPFIKYSRNFIEWYQCNAISHFFGKLRDAENGKVRVLHIGDSHLQTDYYTGTLRNTLQSIFGYGGRGFVFPYKSAGTHSAYDYLTQSTGKWEFCRNVCREPDFGMGISGATIHTTDVNASFTLLFRKTYQSIRPDFTKLRIFCKTDTSSFGIALRLGNDTLPIRIPVFQLPNLGYVDVILPRACDTIAVSFFQADSLQNSFECSGLVIESAGDTGILYSSVGINGAGYLSILKQKLFEKQLVAYQPDLVVIDLGANDFYPNKYNEAELELHLSQIITIIRKAAPSSSVLLTNSHDLWKRKKNVPWCRNFSLFTRKMAQKYQCAFYDYYQVSGGPFALAQWRKAGLAQPDRVHLTYKGYALKAELMSNAILTSYREYIEKNPDQLTVNQFMADTSELDENVPDSVIATIPVAKPIPMVSQTTASTKSPYHIVKKGESLSTIAEKYDLTNAEIKNWNRLKNNKVFAGQKLRVAPPISHNPTQTTHPAPEKNRAQPVYHKVKPGESLYTIAKKYHTTVKKIKQLNKMKSDVLKPGMQILIKN